MLQDECGCMPDARPIQRLNRCDDHCPTDKLAQQMPGGDFVVAFCVEGQSSKTSKYDDEQQVSNY